MVEGVSLVRNTFQALAGGFLPVCNAWPTRKRAIAIFTTALDTLPENVLVELNELHPHPGVVGQSVVRTLAQSWETIQSHCAVWNKQLLLSFCLLRSSNLDPLLYPVTMHSLWAEEEQLPMRG